MFDDVKRYSVFNTKIFLSKWFSSFCSRKKSQIIDDDFLNSQRSIIKMCSKQQCHTSRIQREMRRLIRKLWMWVRAMRISKGGDTFQWETTASPTRLNHIIKSISYCCWSTVIYSHFYHRTHQTRVASLIIVSYYGWDLGKFFVYYLILLRDNIVGCQYFDKFV